MANVPADRLSPEAPFTYSAVDYFGPFYIKESRKMLKRYGVLFTCMSCRAIYLENANSLEAPSLMRCDDLFQHEGLCGNYGPTEEQILLELKES